MEEIEVGEFVRTHFGIAKLIKKEPLKDFPRQIIYTFDNISDELWSGDLPNEMWQSEIDLETEEFGNPFLKHSFNIIDLIEVEDIVKVKDHDWIRVFNIDDEVTLKSFIEDYEENNWTLMSIVTKEQFQSVEYRLEE